MFATSAVPFWQAPEVPLLCYLAVASAVAYSLVAIMRDRHAPMAGDPPRRRAPSGPRVLLLAWLPLPAAAFLEELHRAVYGDAVRLRELSLILVVITGSVVGVWRGWGWMLPCALWAVSFVLVAHERLDDSGSVLSAATYAGVPGIVGAVFGAILDAASAEQPAEADRRSRD